MRLRIGVALSLSALLILGATYFRWNSATPLAGVVSIETVQTAAGLSYNSDTTRENSAEDLSTTDLVSRQLMADFLALVNTGQATSENIINLADKYAANVPSLYEPATNFEVSELLIVPDTSQNYREYSSELFSLIEKLELGPELNDQSEDLTSLNILAKSYARTVNELKSMSVPGKVAGLHASLVNKFATNAKTLAIISDSESDPILTMASLFSIRDTMEAEEKLLETIVEVVEKYE